MAAGEESASGSVKSKKKAVCWKYFEKVSNSESTNNGKAKCWVSCNFCGEELTYTMGPLLTSTSTWNVNILLKLVPLLTSTSTWRHPIETDQASKPKQLKLDDLCFACHTSAIRTPSGPNEFGYMTSYCMKLPFNSPSASTCVTASTTSACSFIWSAAK